jgi:carbonic anhydrase
MQRTPEFSRKSLMLGAGIGLLALATGCARTGAAAAPAPTTAPAAPHWEYAGATGPEKWGSLSPSYGSCQTGTEQAPVDLKGGTRRGTSPGHQGIELLYQAAEAEVHNNGHTVELRSLAPQAMVLDGLPWTFKQLHFHAPSEHTLDGVRYEAEFHFVHQSDDGRLAVLGALATEGKDNAAWAAFVRAAGAPGSASAAPAGAVDFAALLTGSLDHFAYSGSLTTPPCSEDVQWLLLESPVELGRGQLDALRAVHADNARPVQPLNGRDVSVVDQ